MDTHYTLEDFYTQIRLKYPKIKIMVPEIQFGHLACNLLFITQDSVIIEGFWEFLKEFHFIKHYEIVNNFINIFIDQNIVGNIITKPTLSNQEPIHIEFLSPNPTGPMHIAHCRNAFIGDSISRFLSFVGHKVTNECYFNNIGNQVEKFIETIHHYQGKPNTNVHYKGDYVIDLAKQTINMDDKSILDTMIHKIKNTMTRLKLHFDVFTYESDITLKTQEIITILEEKNMITREGHKVLLCSSEFGDDQDRVLQRENGIYTYIANDITYHKNKRDRGFRKQIIVLGMDHAGYFARLRAGLVNFDIQLTIVTYNAVKILDEDNNRTKISKRGGTLITADEVLDELNCDTIKAALLSKGYNSEIGISVDLLKNTKDLSFYLKYANARINSFKENYNPNISIDLNILNDNYSKLLMQKLIYWPFLINDIYETYDMTKMFGFLFQLGQDIHSFLSNVLVVDYDPNITQTKIKLLFYVQEILHHGAFILNIELPDKV